MGNTENKTFLVEVLGCKVNQYDARQIVELLEGFGLEAVSEPRHADIIVIHTCGVTSTAAQKSRQTIRRMQRDNDNAHIIVTGCAAENQLTETGNEPTLRVPAGKEWLQKLAQQIEQLDLPRSSANKDVRTDETIVSSFGDQTRAFLKIQDGCDIGCSYCIVPSLRKAPRDKPIDIAVREAETLTRNGYREIVITGVSVGLYGRDSGHSLAKVLKRIRDIPNIGRIRMSSLHPAELTPELLEQWAASRHVMPHLHLSLQSGSDAILKAMRRNYTTAEFRDAVKRARSMLDNPAFTTDVIVGFPGETDADFSQTLDFCREIGFSRIHVFSFSPRPGTPAARMGNQVDGKTAARRNNQLRQLGAELSKSFHERFIGKTVDVLVEDFDGKYCQGLSEHYIQTQFLGDASLKGTIVTASIQTASIEGITGIKKLSK